MPISTQPPLRPRVFSTKSAAKGSALAVLVALISNCTGILGDPDGYGGNDSDRDLQASDPEVFEVAQNYFPGEKEQGSAPRLFRLTRRQLQTTTETVLPAGFVPALESLMPPDPRQTNYEYAQNLGFNNANFTPFNQWVGQIAERVREEPQSIIDCDEDDGECLDAAARAFVTRAFRGVTRPEQMQRFVKFFRDSVAEVGLPQAAADLATVTLSSSSYLFREEVLTDAQGRLLPPQLLQAVAYTLADAPPEAVGLSSDSDLTRLETPEGLDETIDRVLATPAARAKLVRFFMDWLEVREAGDFDISPTVFPEFTEQVARAAVEETRKFLEVMLEGDQPTLHAITQSTESFISDDVAELYGVEPGPADQLTSLDPEQRLGIFTQPAVIASHSGPTTTRLVKRGVFFVRKVMCMPLGAPPAGSDIDVEPTPGVTERKLIEEGTAAPSCAGCHAYINPFGFMQENYDAIGRWRTMDAGQPVDASISVDFLDEGPLTSTTPVEALKGFTSSARFKQCFARQLFRFYMGRDESPGDDPILRRMFFHFEKDDEQDIKRMLRQLMSSYSFTQRAEMP